MQLWKINFSATMETQQSRTAQVSLKEASLVAVKTKTYTKAIHKESLFELTVPES